MSGAALRQRNLALGFARCNLTDVPFGHVRYYHPSKGKVMDRDVDEWIRRIREGTPMRVIGEEHGISKQRVHQILSAERPNADWKRRRLVQYGPEYKPCRTCGNQIMETRRYVYCSDECSDFAAILVFVTNEEAWDKHRGYTDESLPGTEPRARWVLPGSEVHKAILHAIDNHYPIADEIDPRVRESAEANR